MVTEIHMAKFWLLTFASFAAISIAFGAGKFEMCPDEALPGVWLI